MVLSLLELGTALAELGDLDLSLVDVQDALWMTFEWSSRTALSQRTWATYGSVKGCPATVRLSAWHQVDGLTVRTGDARCGVRSAVPGEGVQTERGGVWRATTDGTGVEGDALFGTDLAGRGTSVAAVYFERIHLGTLFELGHSFRQQRFIVGGVGGNLNIGDQLHGIVGVAGLTEVNDIASIALPVLLAVGRFAVVG